MTERSAVTRPGAALIRAGIAAALVFVAAALAYAGWRHFRPEKAPHARQQAQLAAHDALWQTVPSSMRLQSSWTVLGDAAWVPWANSLTGVGRYYTSTLPKAAALAEWERSAGTAGWILAGRRCDGAHVTLSFTKTLGRWPALLRIRDDVTLALGASIRLPLSPGQRLPSGSSVNVGTPAVGLSGCR